MPAGRRLAWAGVAAPVGFVAAWVAAGAMTPGYSPITQPVSRLAAAESAHRGLMNAGLLTFAAAMPVYATALRAALPGRAWMLAVASGAGTAAVAATPLGYSARLDAAHAAAATGAYLALAALPVAAARPLAATGRPRAAQASVAVGVAAGAALAASTTGVAVGLFQRGGFTLVDTWIALSAVALVRGRLERTAGGS